MRDYWTEEITKTPTKRDYWAEEVRPLEREKPREGFFKRVSTPYGEQVTPRPLRKFAERFESPVKETGRAYFKEAQPAFKMHARYPWEMTTGRGGQIPAEEFGRVGKMPWGDILEETYPRAIGQTTFGQAVVKPISGALLELGTKPSTYITAGIAEKAIPWLGAKAVATPARRKFATKYLPTFMKGALEKTALVQKHPFESIAQRQLKEADPVFNITQAIKAAKPIRAEQEALYTAERAKRATRVAQIGEKIPGEAGYHAQLGALKGELPKVQYEGIKGKVSQMDVDRLYSMIEQNTTQLPLEKVSTKTALTKLLGAEGGTVPTEGEIRLLSEIFPQDFIQTVLSKRPLTQQLFAGAGEVLNVPRAVMASTDFSAPFRQGVFLIPRHPIASAKAFGNMFRYAFSEKAYKGLMQDIKNRPTYALMRKGGLPLTDIGGQLTAREEAFMGAKLAEKIPAFGRIVRASNRAHTGFLNKLRADVFDGLVNSFQKTGIKVEGKVLQDLAGFIGTATARPTLPKSLEGLAVALNATLFSPRLQVSRLRLINPVYYMKLSPPVRKEALKTLLTFSGSVMSILGLAKMGGAEVGSDPRSADFAKIKVGQTRYDVMGGFQQYIRLGAQLVTGEHISSTTGVKTTVGEGYKPLTRAGILGRFIETKEAPIASLAMDLLRGQTRFGEELDVPKEVMKRFVPMVIQDAYDISKEEGIGKIGMVAPAIFGTGVQTYTPTAKEMVYSAGSVIKNYKDLLKQGRVEEAGKLMDRNVEIIRTGKVLEPLQKTINKFEKLKDDTHKSTFFSEERKKQLITRYDEVIKNLNSQMDKMHKRLKK